MIISHQYLCHHERPTCQVCPPSFLSQTASCPPFPQLLLLSSACGCREGESCDEQHMPLVHPISFSLSICSLFLFGLFRLPYSAWQEKRPKIFETLLFFPFPFSPHPFCFCFWCRQEGKPRPVPIWVSSSPSDWLVHNSIFRIWSILCFRL